MLQVVAGRIRANTRKSDVAARLSGDEFVVIAKGYPSRGMAVSLANRLIRAIRQPIEIDAGTVTVGASVGLALFPADGQEAGLLLNHADMALRKAKVSGRNNAQPFVTSMAATRRERRVLEQELREALERETFYLEFQPIVDARSHQPSGFEALLRWNSPTRGPLSPAAFVPFAEEIGLMPQIGGWVMAAACREALSWPEDLSVSVNLSPTQLRQEGIAAEIQSILRQTGLSPRRLELEITETAAIDDMEAAQAVLEEIVASGVHIALDDFGTGSSSLSLITSLPFERIKIDRSFVADIGAAPRAIAVIRAVCGICRDLDVRATAEGVETNEQVSFLSAEGCHDLQGYLISKPMRGHSIAGWLASRSKAIGING